MFETFGTTSEACFHPIITPFYITDRRSLMLAHSLQLTITVPSRVMYWTVLKCEIVLFTSYVCNTGWFQKSCYPRVCNKNLL